VKIEAGPGPQGGGEVRIVAEGLKAKLKPDTAFALRGETPETGFQGYSVQPAITFIIARQCGAEVLTRESVEKVEFVVQSPRIQVIVPKSRA
jgi:histidine phosphotransferase ChpT